MNGNGIIELGLHAALKERCKAQAHRPTNIDALASQMQPIPPQDCEESVGAANYASTFGCRAEPAKDH